MTEESRVSRTPKIVLGWSVPDHIESGTIGRWVNVTCRHAACHGQGIASRTYYVPAMSVTAESAPFAMFLRSHAHGGEVVEVLPDAPEPQRATEPPNGRDAGSGDGWDKAIDWLLNSRYLDSDVLEHFWHMCDGFTDCRWCYEELKDTNHAIPMPKGYDL